MDDSNGLTLDFNLSLATILVIVDFVVRVLAIIYVPRNRRPQTALAWLLAIFFIPYIGILLFLLVGNSKLPRGRRRKQQEINQYILEGTEGMEDVKRDPPWPDWLEPIVELNRNLGAMPLVGGNVGDAHKVSVTLKGAGTLNFYTSATA